MALYSRRSGASAFQPRSSAGRFCGSYFSSSPGSTFASSTSSSFASRSSSLLHPRSASPTRVNLYGHSQSAPSVRFSLERPISPGKSISSIGMPARKGQIVRKPSKQTQQKRSCLCSPTTHPGSFRCSLHKGLGNGIINSSCNTPSNRLNARRSAMTNSLVRICGVEGDLMKRALSALIRPSSHHQRRRADFQPRPSRLSKMSKAEDL